MERLVEKEEAMKFFCSHIQIYNPERKRQFETKIFGWPVKIDLDAEEVSLYYDPTKPPKIRKIVNAEDQGGITFEPFTREV